jgi:hypothetical protein
MNYCSRFDQKANKKTGIATRIKSIWLLPKDTGLSNKAAESNGG